MLTIIHLLHHTFILVLLRTNSANGVPTVAVEVVAHVVTARIEAEAPRVVRSVRVERTRPVVAVGTSMAELTIVAAAGSRQKD